MKIRCNCSIWQKITRYYSHADGTNLSLGIGKGMLLGVVLFGSLFVSFATGLFYSDSTYAADSITLSIDTNNISLDLAPYTATGQFGESTPTNISVSTTSTSGYTLSIVSSTGSTDLTNTTDNTSKITSISSNLTNADFSSPSNTQHNNKWGYKPSQYVTINGDTHTTHTNTGANAVFKPLPGQAGEILAITEQANQQNSPDTYTISMGARVNNTIPTGSYQSGSFVIMAVENIVVMIDCDDTKLCVQYDGNGLKFPATAEQTKRVVNNVNYDSAYAPGSRIRYAHMGNVGDDGIATGDLSTISTNTAIDDTQTVTITGAESLTVTLYYDTYIKNKYGYVSVYQSPFTISTSNDGSVSATTGNLSGRGYGRKSGRTTNYSTWKSATYTVTGDTVKFHFYRSDTSTSYRTYYGYYAVVSASGDRTLTSGEYATPTGNAIFNGWSSTATTPGAGLPSSVEYADEAAVKSNMPGDNTETKTLYAVWQQEYPITFTMDSNTSSIEVVDANGTTVDTITASGQSLNLLGGDTYTLKPTYATGYTTNTITKTTGAGTITPNLPNADFTVGAGTATINVTSRALITFDQAFANAGKTKYNGYYKIQDTNSTICSSVDSAEVGAIGEVIDTRDNQVYKIGRLKDDKCWMLDNLALDLTNDTVLNNLTADNTNIDTTNDPGALAALKGTTPGTTSDKYATAKVANWTSGYSYSAPLVNLTNKDVIPQGSDPMASTVLAGEWKVGGYYNYCAASAGSYCYGDGISEGTSSGNATSSICPKGWRMPTSLGGETNALYNAYSSGSPNQYTAFRTAFHLPLSGDFYDGSAEYQGSVGYFWSSTRQDNSSMYDLYLTTSYVYPASNNTRRIGYLVRCLLES